jgi:transposase
MTHRHAISAADWDRIKDLLPGRPGQHGGVARDNRLFIDAVLYVGRTGVPWADLPARFGKPNTVWRRFDRWAKAGRWDPILAALRDPDLDLLILDSTAVRAHPCAAGAKKSGTAPAGRGSRPSAAAAAASGRRSTAAPTASAIPPSCS